MCQNQHRESDPCQVLRRCLYLLALIVAVTPALAQDDEASIDEAREALAQGQDDEDSTDQLEEVFQATEDNYSLLQSGMQSLEYSFNYSFQGDQRLDLAVIAGQVRNLDVTPDAEHTFTNSLTYDYGFRDNLTFSVRLPFVSKFDTEDDLDVNDIGDISVTTRWQPNPRVPGTMTTTLFSTLTTTSGVSPYEIDVNRQLSSGSGFWSLSGGASASKVMDPVVLFGSGSFRYSRTADDLNQVRGARLLREIDPGYSVSASAGLSYSLSFDVSLSMSAQLTFNDETVLSFNDGSEAAASEQMSGLVNFSVGTRVSDNRIINTNVGFGLTRQSPDFTVGVSVPLNISGLAESS